MERIAVINDLSGLGKCSLTAAIPVISCLGVQACPVPTAVLTNQTGYASFILADHTDMMPDFVAQWKACGIDRFDGIFSGFLSSPQQVVRIEEFLTAFRREDTIVVVDPVMGDNGSVYAVYTQEMCQLVRRLVSHADVITPNLTEAYLLLDRQPHLQPSPEETAELALALSRMGPRQVVITGVERGEYIDNVICDNGRLSTVRVRSEGGSYSGTGDLLASVIAAGLVKGGHTLEEIVRAATVFIARALAQSHREGTDRNDGIAFEGQLPLLWEMLP